MSTAQELVDEMIVIAHALRSTNALRGNQLISLAHRVRREFEMVKADADARSTAVLPEITAEIINEFRGIDIALIEYKDGRHDWTQDAKDFAALVSAPSAWPTIETAPKDGTTVLLFRRVDPWDVYGYGYWEGGKSHVSGWISHGFVDPPGNLGLAAPTHWQRLPTAPSTDKPIRPKVTQSDVEAFFNPDGDGDPRSD